MSRIFSKSLLHAVSDLFLLSEIWHVLGEVFEVIFETEIDVHCFPVFEGLPDWIQEFYDA